jgi:Flp pilus assembly protein TadG
MKPPAPMRKRLTENIKSLAIDTVAAEVAEAAVVLPLLFTVLLGIYWFGQAFRTYGTIARAAQEGARAAAAPACSTCTTLTVGTSSTNAYTAISNVLNAASLSPSNLQMPSTIPSAKSCLDGTTVINSCDGTEANICVQYNVELSDTTKGGNLVCGVAVSFQYPYQFWLPFTSLNLQSIKLPAAAHVRQESQ